MAAKLEWTKQRELRIGRFELAYLIKEDGQWRMSILPVPGSLECEKARYESPDDAQQDCESEVRRLLKEAGIDCE